MGGGCANEHGDGEGAGVAQQAIYDAGDAIPSSKPQVLSIQGPPGAYCGASLVASNVLLTAAHCLDKNDFANGGTDKPIDPGGTSLSIIGPGIVGPLPAVSLYYDSSDPNAYDPGTGIYHLIFHPAWDEGTRDVWNDVGLIVFSPPVSRDVAIPLTIAPIAHDGACATYDVYGRKGADATCGNNAGTAMLFLADREGCPGGLPLGPQILDFDNLGDPEEGSAVCLGDSGSPILDSNGHIASLVSDKHTFLDVSVLGPIFGGLQVADNYAWLIPEAIDRDGDGIPAPIDNCDIDFNPNQDDLDGDGLGNACDPCWTDPNHESNDGDLVIDCLDRCPDDGTQVFTAGYSPCGKDANGNDIKDVLGDSDCDGICDSHDNCPFTPNSLQLNNNYLSEGVHIANIVGDACEPVLVPDGEPEDGETHVALNIDGTFFKMRAEVVTRDEIIVRPQPSRESNEDYDETPEEIAPENVETHFRFCQPDEDITCTAGENVDDARLRLDLPNATSENSGMPYHRVTMSFAPISRGATWPIDYDGEEVRFTWDYEKDGAFWDATGIVDFPGPDGAPVPGGILGGQYSGLSGTFWMHAASDVGHPGGTILATGVHPGEEIEGTELLANRYFASEPEQASVYHAVLPLELERPLFYWEILPDPPPWRAIIAGVRPGDDALLLATPGDNYVLVSPDGSGQIVTDRLGKHLFENLQDETLRWTSAVEPSLAIGAADSPMALGLRSTGLIAEQVRLSVDQGGLLGVRDIGGETPLPGTFAAEAVSSGPVCAEFEPVYSRMLGRLFLLGCLEGAGRRTVWRSDVADGPWSRLAVTLDLGPVRAATLSHRDGLIYLLDEAPGTGGSLRLVRLDPHTGAYRVLAQSNKRSNYDRHWLVSDRDGSLLLTASSDQMNETVVARIDVRDLTVTRAYKGKGPLAERPIVQQRSYHLYRRDGQGTSVERIEALENKEFSWHRVEKLL